MQRKTISHICAFAGLVLLAGCEQKVKGPTPELQSVMPQVVCNAQLTTKLDVTGKNLTPLPIRTLGGTGGLNQPQAVQLPALSLALAGNLDGSAASGSPVPIPDDYDDAAAGRVKWSSEMAMSFEVFPELMLSSGVHALTVRNPDGQEATLQNALAVVPPPKITKVEPMAICNAQSDQTIVVTGTGFLTIDGAQPSITISPVGGGGVARTYTPAKMEGCTAIAASVRGGLEHCSSITILVKQNDLAPGEYEIKIRNPSPADCSSTESIRLKVNPPPKVASVLPMTICQGGGDLNVKGSDFQDKPKVTLGMTEAGNVMFVSPMEVNASFGGGMSMFTPDMKYDLTLTNPDGCKDTLANAVTAVAGPILFFADPPVLFNGITTQVTLYATAIAQPVTSVTMRPTGGGMPIPLQPLIDQRYPKRILVNIPKGTPAGSYDITVVDDTKCPATLVKGITIVDKTTLTITAIDPPFGYSQSPTAVNITAMGGLQATPRVFLNPHTPGPNAIATPLASIAFLSATRITAVVPKGVDPGANPYDVIVVNPDGGVGVLTMPNDKLYKSTALPPPVIDNISPGAVPNNAAPPIDILGSNFRNSNVEFNCVIDVNTGAKMTFPAQPMTVTTTPSKITVTAPPVAQAASPGFCTIRVTNGDDMTFADFSALAISNGSGNLANSKMGTALPAARRAPAVLGSSATRVNRFLYVIGGDTGMPGGALDSVVSISTDETGTGAAWSQQRYALNKKRTLAGYTSLGRYLYVVGGHDGTNPVNSAERAIVLDPAQAPVVSDVDIVPGGGQGVGGGAWFYRVAAVMDGNDNDNPGGETLPSDVTSLQLPDLTQKVKVTLFWTGVAGAVGYRVYRTPMPNQIAGQEALLAEVMGGNTRTYTDTGTMTMAGTPLPQGSTGRWKTLPMMTSVRESPGVALGTDPQNPSTKYLYATMGRSAMAAQSSYEFLTVNVALDGQQIAANSWTAGNTMVPAARYQHSIYSADRNNCSFLAANINYIYLGGGTANGMGAVQSLDAGRVAAGGQLGNFVQTGATVKSFGHGFTVAANYLYTFGDEGPSGSIRAGQLTMNQPMGGTPAITNVNNNGTSLLTARYLPGTALQGALIYVVGGSNNGRNGATNSVEWMIW